MVGWGYTIDTGQKKMKDKAKENLVLVMTYHQPFSKPCPTSTGKYLKKNVCQNTQFQTVDVCNVTKGTTAQAGLNILIFFAVLFEKLEF